MNGKLRRDVGEIKELVSSINAALIVREPGTAMAADAYEGLRRQVAQATAERRAHLIELVRVLEALDSGVTVEALQRLVEQWAEQTHLSRWNDPEPIEFFEVIGDGDGPLEVVRPAWVAGDPATLVKQGLLRRHDAATAPEPEAPDVSAGEPTEERQP